MWYQRSIEYSECDTGVFPMNVAGQLAIRNSQDVEPETGYLEDRARASTTNLFGPFWGRSSTPHRGNINRKSRGPKKSECCEDNLTHGFGCACLDKESLPWTFQTMLGILCHILGYLLISHALVELDGRVQEKFSISRLVPEFTHLMQMGLDWDIQYIPSFLGLLFHFYGLQLQVFCETGRGGVDHVITLRPVSERMTPNDSPAPQAACDSCVPICPVVIQHGPYDDPTVRIRMWLSKHLNWLETNNLIPDGELWPVPYFLVDSDKWRFGFAVHSKSGFMLYDEFIGSMGWKNGIRKIVVILKLVIETTIQRHRKWFYERALQEIPSDDKGYPLSEKLSVSPRRVPGRAV